MTIAADLAALTDLDVDRVTADAMDTTADDTARALTNVGRTITGGDGRLSNARGRLDATVSTGRRSAVVALTPLGLWRLVVDGARPHLIGETSGRRVLKLADGGYVSGQVRHPGTRGRGGRRLTAIYRTVDRTLETNVDRALREAMP